MITLHFELCLERIGTDREKWMSELSKLPGQLHSTMNGLSGNSE